MSKVFQMNFDSSLTVSPCASQRQKEQRFGGSNFEALSDESETGQTRRSTFAFYERLKTRI